MNPCNTSVRLCQWQKKKKRGETQRATKRGFTEGNNSVNKVNN